MLNYSIDKSIKDIRLEIDNNIGIYNFINSLPISIPLYSTNINNLKILSGTPNEINNLLINGELNAGPMSTFEYLKNKNDFVLLKGLSISSQKEVGSVILFSKLPLKELGNKNIAVTHTSSTSVNLLKLLITKYSSKSPSLTLHYNNESIESILSTYDAVLLIGDSALINAIRLESNDSIIIYDLARLWYQYTSLPMVFCVWVAQKEWANKYSKNLENLNNLLIKCKEQGISSYFEDIIMKAAEISEIKRDLLVKYYQNQLSYNLGDIEELSLKQFYCNLKENNLL